MFPTSWGPIYHQHTHTLQPVSRVFCFWQLLNPAFFFNSRNNKTSTPFNFLPYHQHSTGSRTKKRGGENPQGTHGHVLYKHLVSYKHPHNAKSSMIYLGPLAKMSAVEGATPAPPDDCGGGRGACWATADPDGADG